MDILEWIILLPICVIISVSLWHFIAFAIRYHKEERKHGKHQTD